MPESVASPASPRVHVAMVNHGAAGVSMTAKAIMDVLRQGVAAEMTVTIIDDGSGEGVLAALREVVPSTVTVSAQPKNLGYGAAGNVALSQAREQGASFCWLLNNDLQIEDGCLGELVAALQEDERAAAAIPAIIDPHRPDVVIGAGADIGRARARVRYRYLYQPLKVLPDSVFRVDAIQGVAPLLRVEACDDFGGFDPGYFMYWEDTDWSRRARSAGWRLLVAPRARVRHYISQSSTLQWKTEMIIRNRIRYARLDPALRYRLAFAAYFGAWLPGYVVARLVPRFGVRRGISIAISAIAWNVRDILGPRPRVEQPMGRGARR